MTVRRARAWFWTALSVTVLAACGAPFAPKYEYEEQLYLSVDGSASVTVNASLPALAVLRGLVIAPAAGGAIDREAVARQIEAVGCPVDRVSRSWRRRGRTYIEIEMATDDVHRLSACGLLAWSSYWLSPTDDDGLRYRQTAGAAAANADRAGASDTGWNGAELVAFKVHVPSRVRYHTVKRLDGTSGAVERGNILTWEQRLADRGAGPPLLMEVEMDATSILNTTMWLFGGAFAAAVLALVLAIWLTMRRGRKTPWPPPTAA
jgi:hypothetical protein